MNDKIRKMLDSMEDTAEISYMGDGSTGEGAMVVEWSMEGSDSESWLFITGTGNGQ